MSKGIKKDDPDYEEKRRRNNEAIKKSREKAKKKQSETQAQVDALKKENERVEGQIKTMEGQLEVMKGILKAHAAAPPTGPPSASHPSSLPGAPSSQQQQQQQSVDNLIKNLLNQADVWEAGKLSVFIPNIYNSVGPDPDFLAGCRISDGLSDMICRILLDNPWFSCRISGQIYPACRISGPTLLDTHYYTYS